jgi:hypothetical protein
LPDLRSTSSLQLRSANAYPLLGKVGRARFIHQLLVTPAGNQRTLLSLTLSQVGHLHSNIQREQPKVTHEWIGIIVNEYSDPQTDKASGNPEAAICVQNFSARRVLQFTPIIAASCVLHRSVNRVIHRLKLYLIVSVYL